MEISNKKVGSNIAFAHNGNGQPQGLPLQVLCCISKQN